MQEPWQVVWGCFGEHIVPVEDALSFGAGLAVDLTTKTSAIVGGEAFKETDISNCRLGNSAVTNFDGLLVVDEK